MRAGIVSDPKDYRYCGYAEALAGKKVAREGIKKVMMSSVWREAGRLYRTHLYIEGREKGLTSSGKALKSGFSHEKVEEVLQNGGKLPMHILLRCQVRYFSNGLVLGSKEFVENVFLEYRDQFGLKRSTGARRMKYGHWNGLYTMRDLKIDPVRIT